MELEDEEAEESDAGVAAAVAEEEEVAAGEEEGVVVLACFRSAVRFCVIFSSACLILTVYCLAFSETAVKRLSRS